MIIGSNPRKESPVLNARIRKRWLKGNLLVGVIGEKADLTYDYNYLGAGPESLARFVDHPPAQKERPLLLIGQGALARPDGQAILAQAARAAVSLGCIKPGWTGFGVLHTAAARVGALDLGFVPGDGGLDAQSMAKAGGLDVLFNLGADEIDVAPGAFVIYQGTHGDRGAHRADVILPGATYTEKPGLYVNTEGRVQLAERANFPPGDAREDWAILRALSAVLGKTLPFDSLHALAAAAFCRRSASSPGSTRLNPAIRRILPKSATVARRRAMCLSLRRSKISISPIPIARASAVMAECSALRARANSTSGGVGIDHG